MSDAAHPTPFREVPGGSASSRRLLLISLVFPPGQGVGGLRWQKMARHLHERGWELDVITLHPACLDAPDWNRVEDLPPGTRLFGARTPMVPLARAIEFIWSLLRAVRSRLAARRHDAHLAGTAHASRPAEPTSLARSEIRWSLGNPRAYIRAYNAWFAYAELKRSAHGMAALGERVVRSGDHDAVISSGPPHSAHEAARQIARHTSLPFVMDMRDPWSLFQRSHESIASPLLIHLGRRHERRAIEQAALVVANTDGARAAMVREYPEASARIITVTNGFDDDRLPGTQQGSRFTIAHAGTLYLDRDPSSLLRAARQVIDELHLSPEQFAIEFIGANDGGFPLASAADELGIGAYVHVRGARPRVEALELLGRSSMLVILPQDSDTAIPAKVFEYVRFDAWLLALAERDSATGLLLRDTGADIVPASDIVAIAATIRERYQQYASGMRPRAIATDPRLSRRAQAEILLDALEKCLGRRSPGGTRASRGALLQETAT